jgi:GH24 family phage-related lysozyme (muramidase)
LLSRDLKKAFECVSDSIWKKNRAVLTDYQNTALVSFAQSVNCDIIEKFSKKVVLTDAASANTFFLNLIAKADTTTSDYLTLRRAAEKALFGIV